MGFNSVYQCLIDVFPQVDKRLLKAIAIENSKDADAAVEIVLTEVLPILPKLSVSPKDKSPLADDTFASNDKNPTEALTHTQKNKSPIYDSDSTPEEPSPIELSDGGDNQECRFLVRRRRVAINKPPSFGAAKVINGGVGSETNIEAGQATADADLGSTDLAFGSSLVDSKTFNASPVSSCYDSNGENLQISANTENEEVILLGGTKELKNVVESSKIDGNIGNADQSPVCGNIICEDTVPLHKFEDDSIDMCEEWKDFDEPGAIGIDLNISAEAQNSLPIPVATSVEEHSRNESIHGDKDEPTLNTIVTRSGQICNVDLLEEIIEDAKNNKKNLFLAMESIMNMMGEVELEEKAAEQAKEEAADTGLDIMKKVEELKEMLSHAKEANDMHAGKVYGEKSILGTEVRELQTSVLSLSDERDKSLAILDEIRQTLEARRAEAEKVRKAAEKEKLEKTESAQSFLAEQEAAMENVVQESKILQQTAEENSKLQDFLIERGRVVDTLQGEISVICQDVRLLKENFDNRVPLIKSISSSQTSCILASSSSSLKSIASDLEKSVSPKEGSPAASLYGQLQKSSESPKNKFEDETSKADHKELLDDGWDLFEVENGTY
jgi:hypothetical protein